MFLVFQCKGSIAPILNETPKPKFTNNIKTMIEAYGRFWNRDLVKWDGKKGDPRSLAGTLKRKKEGKPDITIETNCWDQEGIYVLYDGYDLVYIGEGNSTPLGARLSHHRKDHLKDRWNKFSWYGIRKINDSGTLKKHPVTGTKIRNKDYIKDYITSLEAIAIYIADPPLNSQAGSFKKPDLVTQKNYDERPLSELSDRELLEKILRRLA